MKRRLFNLSVFGTLVALMLVGCSKESSVLTKDQVSSNASKAPLLRNASIPAYLNQSYIVVFKDDIENIDGEIDAVVEHQNRSFGVKPEFVYKHALKGFAAALPDAAVEALRNNPEIAYIEQNQEAHIVGTQSNPPSWGLDRVDQQDLPLSLSYTYNQTGTGVDAYIFDTGILLTHNDFGGRAITGYDAITFGGTATDGNGHGTHVSGTVGGNAYGIAKNVRLIAVRVLNNQGSGTYSQVIAGLNWAISNHTTKPAVGNMSLGGPVSTSLDAAVRNVVADGIVLCVAAGNSGANASNYSPSRVAEAITVGATSSTDVFASWSNYGSVVDILAPGVSITSDYYTSNTATATMSGTSMATPHVTGAAALFKEANPSATPAEVSNGLKANATPDKITSLPSGTANLLLYTIGGTVPPPSIPAPPALKSPANTSTGIATNPTLSWNASSGVASYAVEVSTSSGFESKIYNVSGITATSVNLSGLASITTYYWRVNATNSAGTSAWSDIWSFTTTDAFAVPLAPLLIAPSNGATGISIPAVLSWNASTGATSYFLQVSRYSNFLVLIQNVTLDGTSYSVSNLSKKTKYYWRVSAKNTAGTSPWSMVRNFTTAR